MFTGRIEDRWRCWWHLCVLPWGHSTLTLRLMSSLCVLQSGCFFSSSFSSFLWRVAALHSVKVWNVSLGVFSAFLCLPSAFSCWLSWRPQGKISQFFCLLVLPFCSQSMEIICLHLGEAPHTLLVPFSPFSCSSLAFDILQLVNTYGN